MFLYIWREAPTSRFAKPFFWGEAKRRGRASNKFRIEGPLGVSSVSRGHENLGNSKHETRNTKQIQNPNDEMTETFRTFEFLKIRACFGFRISIFEF
jgi:hypothetical protein